jgi:hypothetical protein
VHKRVGQVSSLPRYILSRQQGSEALQAKDGKDPLDRAFIELAMQQKERVFGKKERSPSDTSEESHSPGNLDTIPRWLFLGPRITAKALVSQYLPFLEDGICIPPGVIRHSLV